MGLAIKSKRHGGILITLTAVFALIAQPMYGFVAAQVANALGILGQVQINEFSSATGADWVELYNPTGSAVDIAGWVLRDSTVGSQKAILSGVVPAQGFLSVNFTHLNNASGDTIRLFDETDTTLIDSVEYGGTTGVVGVPGAGQYAARTTDGAATWELRATSSQGASNNPITTPSGEFTNSAAAYWSAANYKGINVDVRVKEVSQLTGLSVKVNRTAGGSVEKTAKQKLIDEINAANGVGVSKTAPILVQAGTYTDATSTSWNDPAGAVWDESTVPTDIVLTMTFADSTTKTQTINITPNAVAYADIAPESPAITNVDAYYSVRPDYTAIGVDFKTKAISNATAVELRVNRTDGSTYSITAKQPVIDAVNAAHVTSASGPIIVSGVRTSGSWNNQVGTWTGVALPESVDVLITLANGQVLTLRDTTISNSLATWDQVKPVDATAPSFMITSPVNGTHVAGVVTIDANVADESDITKLLVNIGGVSRSWTNGASSTITRSGDTFSTTIDTNALPDGPVHTVLRGTDGAGNTRYWNNNAANRQHVFTVDNTAPTVKVNLNRTSYINSGDTISKLQNAEIEARDTNLDRIELWKNGVITGHVWTTNDTKRLANIKFLGEGNYEIKAFDKAGNMSDVFTFTVDNTAPAVPTIVDDTVFVKIGQANKILEWTHDGIDTATYEYREYSSYANAVSDTAYWTKTLNAPQLSTTDTASATSKKLYWRVVAIDAVGNRSALSDIGTITIDRDKPVVTGSVEAEYNPANFTITATDNFEVARVTGNLYDADTNVLLKGNSSTTDNPYTVNLNTLADGNYYVRYNAQDEAGNTSNTENFYFTVDQTKPVITVKDDFIGDKAAGIFSQVSFKLHDAQMADKYTINTHEVDFTNNKWSDANFQNIKAHLVEGENTITLFDTAGNSNSYTFTYDSTKPTVVLREDQTIKPSGSYFLTGKTIRVQPQDVNRGKFFVNGVEYPQYFASGSFGINWIVANHPGVEKFIITSQDRAGNMSGEYIVMVDRTAPTVTVKTGTGVNDGSLAGIDDWYRQISFKLYDKNGNLKQVELNGNIYNRGGTWNDLNWLNINKSQLIQGENTVVVRDHEGNSRELKFNYDSVVPTATFSYSNNNGNALTRDDVIVTMTTSEPIQTPADWARLSDQVFTRTYADNGKYSVVIADRAGNESAALKYEVKRIDRGAPTIDGVLDGATVRGTVTLVVADPKYQGVDGFDQNTGLKINGSTVVTTPGEAKTYFYTVSQAGDYTVVATDKAGNSKTIMFTIDNSIGLTINPVVGTAATPTITGTARWNADATPAANQSVSIEVRRNGAVVHVLGPVQTNTAGEWSVQVPALATGSYAVYAAIGGSVAGDAIAGPEMVSVVVPPIMQRGAASPVATANPGIPTIPVQNPQQLNTNFLAFATTTAAPTVTDSSDSEDAEVRGLSTVASAASEDNEDGEVKAAEDAKLTWSLANVLLAAAAVVMGLMALLGLFGKREEGEEAMNGRRITAIALGVGALAGLLFLEDFGGSMSIVDVWSLAFAALVAVQVAIIMSLKRAA